MRGEVARWRGPWRMLASSWPQHSTAQSSQVCTHLHLVTVTRVYSYSYRGTCHAAAPVVATAMMSCSWLLQFICSCSSWVDIYISISISISIDPGLEIVGVVIDPHITGYRDHDRRSVATSQEPACSRGRF